MYTYIYVYIYNFEKKKKKQQRKNKVLKSFKKLLFYFSKVFSQDDHLQVETFENHQKIK